ncbi:MAG TPA: sugar ABC transporter substrate-binding protein [Lachnospiraceae bacterium]|nr:sugar ABC transporter substrate-binding protein [Lachnospiraceae bacterium]
MKKLAKKLFAAVLAGTMVASLVGCGSSTSDSETSSASDAADTAETDTAEEAADTGVTLKFQQWWAVECPEGYVQNICDQFKKDTGITVELISAPFADTKTAIESGAATGTVADLVSVDSSWVYDFADQGVLTDMSTLIDADGFDKSICSDTWDVNGSTYAIPCVNYAYPLFYNKDILDASGVTELPKTWTEFEDVCQKIKDAGYYPFALNLDASSPSGIQNVYMGFAWASGIKFKNDDGTFNVSSNSDLKDFAEFYKDLSDKGYIYPGMASLTESDMTSKFASGEIAFIVNSAAAITAWNKDYPDLNIGAAAIPVKDDYTGQSGNCVASWAVGITENSDHKAEALKFLEYILSGKDGNDGSIDADLAVTQSGFPGSTLAQPDYSATTEVFQNIYQNYSEGYPINEFTGMKEANTIMVDWINELIPYMDGDQDVDTYLGNVQSAIDEVYGQ